MNQTTKLRNIRARSGAGAQAMRALDRDARAPRLHDAPIEGGDVGARMRALRVIVIGLGSVGSYLADLLARATVASLLLIDRGVIKPESVLTHPVHPRDIGRSKGTLAGELAKAVSPTTRVRVHDGPVEELSLDSFVDADAVLLASDNLACELEVSQRCLHLGVPLIQASVHGPTLVAQVRSLANQVGGAGPCLACGYQSADWEALDRGTLYSCAGGPAQPNGIPTVSPAQLCSLAASLAVTELMVRSTDLVPASESRLIEYCGFNHRTTVTPLAARAGCPSEHETWRVVNWKRRLATATPRELLTAAGCTGSGCTGEEALAGVSMTVEGYRFSELGMCACPDHPALGRFRSLGSETSACAACGSPLDGHPFYTHEVVPGIALRAHLDRPLRKLGADAPATVLVRHAEQAFLFYAQPKASR